MQFKQARFKENYVTIDDIFKKQSRQPDFKCTNRQTIYTIDGCQRGKQEPPVIDRSNDTALRLQYGLTA